MKVLFLDIDGVLNSDDNLQAMYELSSIKDHHILSDQFGNLFDERCVRWLHWITERTGCKLVISSSWRWSGIDDLRTMWEYRKLPGEIIDITTLAPKTELLNKYKNESKSVLRGCEIQEWIDLYKPSRYCIVDDIDEMLRHHNFVKTDARMGLTFEEAKTIVKILSN